MNSDACYNIDEFKNIKKPVTKEHRKYNFIFYEIHRIGTSVEIV